MPKILVLDDMVDAAIRVQRVLSSRGHDVLAFTEAADALHHARHNPVDLAVLDVKLKRSSGLDVLRDLKKIHPAMAAVILTAYPSAETAQKARELGAGAFCTKPMDNDALAATVAAQLQGLG